MHRLKTIAPLSVAACALGFLVGIAQPAQAATRAPAAPAAHCQPLEVIAARGSTQPQSSLGGELAPVLQYLQRHLSAYGRSHMRVFNVEYPATLTNYGQSVTEGVWYTTYLLNDIARDCPHTKLELIGYSQGAQVIHEALRFAKPNRKILAAGLISDPESHHVPAVRDPQLFTFGSRVAHDGLFGAGPQLPGYLQMRVIGYCVAGDTVCDFDKTRCILSVLGALIGDFQSAASTYSCITGATKVHTTYYTRPSVSALVGNMLLAHANRNGIK